MYRERKVNYFRERALLWMFGLILNTPLTSCNQIAGSTELCNYPEQKDDEKVFIRTTSPERRHWRRFGVFIVNFEHMSHSFLVFLLTLNK